MKAGILISLAMWIMLGLALGVVGGCGYGVARYSVKPFVVDGQAHCCEVSVENGKEIAHLNARIEKRGDHYRVEIEQDGVEAFNGQRIAAGAARNAAATAATALVAPVAIPAAAAAIGAIVP